MATNVSSIKKISPQEESIVAKNESKKAMQGGFLEQKQKQMSADDAQSIGRVDAKDGTPIKKVTADDNLAVEVAKDLHVTHGHG